jgi:hypothetical protein
MKVNIERVHYASLRNDEFPIVYGQTISICGKYDMKSLHLEKSYDELVSYQPALDSLTVYMRKNAKLTQAGKVEVERDLLINTVTHIVKGYEYTVLPEIQPHYEVLNELLTKHKARTIAKSSRAAETERLQVLEADINASQPAQIALAALGLTPVVTRLFEANRKYETLFREYIAEKGEEQRIDVVAQRRGCSKSLVQFFDAVQYSAYIYEELDYMPLINELTKLHKYYTAQLKARITRRKNGKNTSEEPPIQPMAE